ncbi:MAG TPA: triple tyrosine motif-containing protein, partial [Puia sp.]|nr:triple tyrosine motif-containing protein [Puia sp.]
QDGAFVIKDNRALPVMTKQGVWGFAESKGADTADIIAGTYTGLQNLRYEGGHLREGSKISDLYESLPTIAQANPGAVWASHPYRGIFKIPLPAGHFVHYTTADGLPSNLNNFVYRIRGRIVAATTRGVYEYNAGTDRWGVSSFFQPIFGDTSVECLAEDRDGHIWFVSQQRVGVIDGKVRYFPELQGQTVKDHPFIYPYDDQNIFVGSNNGMLHINYRRYIQSDTGVTVVLGSVKAIAEKDSLLFGGYDFVGGNPPPHLPNHWNSFRFEYSSPLYTQQDNADFSYRLEGFDKEWSGWSSRTEKDYTNLPYGNYTFSVRARNNLGNISLPVSYSFTVDPAWYETIWAWLLYIILAAGIFYWIRVQQQRRLALHQKRHEEEQARLQYLHSLELDRKEKGLIALQNEKLEGELQFKNKELATVTMHLVERGGLLSNVKEELLAVIKKANVPNLSYDLRGVFKMISGTEKSDEDWNRFALYFDEVHNNFLSTLKTKFPLLSPADLKLCAYLRLNLSSKEIAQLLNISLKGVEVSRYRIRKKLNLSSEVNLYDFLIEATHGG